MNSKTVRYNVQNALHSRSKCRPVGLCWGLLQMHYTLQGSVDQAYAVNVLQAFYTSLESHCCAAINVSCTPIAKQRCCEYRGVPTIQTTRAAQVYF